MLRHWALTSVRIECPLALINNLIWTYLLLISGASFLLMGVDKLSAKAGSSRIPELWFLMITVAGGVVGVVLGMFAFHHKTGKRSFQAKIAIAAIVSMLILVFLVPKV
jgi:uncharacterized membrane protein YsdA (DUF1294 family)